MCKDIARKPDFYIIKVDTIDSGDIYSCWVRKTVWVDKVRMCQVETQPYVSGTNSPGLGNDPYLVLLRQRSPVVRPLAGFLPERRHWFAYFLSRFWGIGSIYILTYMKDNQSAQSHISMDSVEISYIGELHLTKRSAKKSFKWWHGVNPERMLH